MENGTDEHSDDDYCHCRIVTGRFGIEDDDGEYGAGKSARAWTAQEQLFGYATLSYAHLRTIDLLSLHILMRSI